MTLRMKAIEVGSNYCDSETFVDVSDNFQIDMRTKSQMTFSDKFKRYMRVGWLQEQSFCYERQTFVTLSPILTIDGNCYGFNLDEDIFEKSM